MRLSPHFTLTEMTKSATAERLGIANEPTQAMIENMRRLATKILEPVRAEFGIPFAPTSGYREPQLNKAIGGAARSQHLTGEAVDFEVPGIANLIVARWIAANLRFDQLILEFWSPGDPGAGWVHCSLKAAGNRGQILTIGRVNGQAISHQGLPHGL